MVTLLLKKSYRHKDLKEIKFNDLWNAYGVFTTMRIVGKSAKILLYKSHIDNLINSYDESTKTPGLYVTGPMLQSHNMIFCFIYKFQQRFAVVANNIGIKLSKDVTVIEQYKKEGMYLDNLEDAKDECAC